MVRPASSGCFHVAQEMFGKRLLLLSSLLRLPQAISI
jgi:hypothetical protein